MNKIIKLLISQAAFFLLATGMFVAGNVALAQTRGDAMVLPHGPLVYFQYEVPDNRAYQALKATIEAKGHEQLGIGKWTPGENDLTPEQVARLDFNSLDYSAVPIGFESPSHGFGNVLVQDREKQVTKQNVENDRLIRGLAGEGRMKPASVISLSQDEINHQVAISNLSWWMNPTAENHTQYILALGMKAARSMDVKEAKAIVKFDSMQIEAAE